MKALLTGRPLSAAPTLVVAAALLLPAPTVVGAQEQTKPETEKILPAPPAAREPSKPSLDALLKPPAKDPKISRKEVLADLFSRLEKAPDEQSAELVAGAIEKIWMQSGSDTVDLLMQRAVQLAENKQTELALDILDSVVEMSPEFAEGWNQRATIFFIRKEFDRSLRDLRTVLALEPRHFKALNGLGLIMQELDRKDAALKAFREALKLYPQLAETKRLEKELQREVDGQGI